MNLTAPRELKSLFEKYKFFANRQRGQNFLVDGKVLNFIVQSADLIKSDFVFEVGAGVGTLTQKLAEKSGSVLSVEIDQTLTKILAQTVGHYKNVKIFKGDVLGRDCYLEIERWKEKNKIDQFKIVANLPYQITSNFLRNFLPRNDWQKMILMVQKEVAERIVAKPGQTSLLSLSVQFYSQPKILRNVSKNSFWPVPEVDSAVLELDSAASFRHLKKIDQQTEKQIFQLMRMGFAARRKQLHNNLAAGLNLDSQAVKLIFKNLNLGEKVRAQELSLDDWFKLSQELKM